MHERTATNTIIDCLVIVANFWCLLQVFAYVQFFLIFLIYFFWIHGHPPDIRHISERSTEYLAIQVAFLPEFQLYL